MQEKLREIPGGAILGTAPCTQLSILAFIHFSNSPFFQFSMLPFLQYSVLINEER